MTQFVCLRLQCELCRLQLSCDATGPALLADLVFIFGHISIYNTDLYSTVACLGQCLTDTVTWMYTGRLVNFTWVYTGRLVNSTRMYTGRLVNFTCILHQAHHQSLASAA